MQITQIQDTSLKLYLGIEIESTQLDSNDLQFDKILKTAESTIQNFADYNKKLLERNRDKYHITIFNAAECAKFPSLLINATGLHVKDSSITFKGIGSISQDDMTTYFIVVYSPVINKLRTDANLPEKDLHITIGFTHKDLFKSRKNEPNLIQF